MSHPSWVRGLKQVNGCALDDDSARSHPSWVRGLKLISRRDRPRLAESHPSWVRGLKRSRLTQPAPAAQSHPSWVRGLKPGYHAQPETAWFVAPFMGAWIETCVWLANSPTDLSRTLHGCVD